MATSRKRLLSLPVFFRMMFWLLAPFLFAILVNYLLLKATADFDTGIITHPRKSSRHPAIVLNDLDFADDIALLESTTSRAQTQLKRTAASARDLGLTITSSTAVPCQLFKWMVIPSNMCQTSNIWAPWWLQVQVIWRNAELYRGELSGSWNACGSVLTYQLQQRWSFSKPFVSLYYFMAVNGW